MKLVEAVKVELAQLYKTYTIFNEKPWLRTASCDLWATGYAIIYDFIKYLENILMCD